MRSDGSIITESSQQARKDEKDKATTWLLTFNILNSTSLKQEDASHVVRKKISNFCQKHIGIYESI